MNKKEYKKSVKSKGIDLDDPKQVRYRLESLYTEAKKHEKRKNFFKNLFKITCNFNRNIL